MHTMKKLLLLKAVCVIEGKVLQKLLYVTSDFIYEL